MSVRIFLSTVSDEFRAYRDQLRSDLTRHNVEVKVQEDFKDYGAVTLDLLDLYIADCDAVIHLVGDMNGSIAKPASTLAILAKHPDLSEKVPPLRQALEQGEDISYTQWEAWLAIYHGKLLFVANASETALRGPHHSPTDLSRASQRIHLQRLSTLERFPRTFTSPDDLAKQIAYTAILDLLAKEKRGLLSHGITALGGAVAASKFVGKVEAFLEEYLITEDGRGVPFAGRDDELSKLDQWLDDVRAPARFIVTAPAGRGKSALLVHWIKRLESRGRLGEGDGRWQLVFMPISLRFNTNRPEVYYEGIADRLAELFRQEMKPAHMDPAAYYEDQCRLLLGRAIGTTKSILLVIDGLDESLGGQFDTHWFPRAPGINLRMLVAARQQVGDVDSEGWIERLNWKSVRVQSAALPKLNPTAVRALLEAAGESNNIVAAALTKWSRLWHHTSATY